MKYSDKNIEMETDEDEEFDDIIDKLKSNLDNIEKNIKDDNLNTELRQRIITNV